MKSFVLSLCCLLLITVDAVSQSKEETDLADVCKAFNKAMIDADKSTLEKLTLKTLSYGHSSGLVENQTQFITALVNGTIDFTNIDITDQTIQVSGKDAIVRNTFKGTLLKDGSPFELKIGLLMVWKNVKGNWQLFARQGYKL
jgi:hypothetical protein